MLQFSESFFLESRSVIKSRTSVCDLLFLPVGNLVLLAKKKSCRNALTFFWGAFQKISQTFHFLGAHLFFFPIFKNYFLPYTGEPKFV